VPVDDDLGDRARRVPADHRARAADDQEPVLVRQRIGAVPVPLKGMLGRHRHRGRDREPGGGPRLTDRRHGCRGRAPCSLCLRGQVIPLGERLPADKAFPGAGAAVRLICGLPAGISAPFQRGTP
jgi:hypothetical protein